MSGEIQKELQKSILMAFMVGEKTPKEIFESFLETTTKNEIGKKLIIQNIINENPKMTEEEVLVSLKNSRVSAQMGFVSTMATLKPIMNEEKYRKELAECLRTIADNIEKIKGNINN